MNYVVERAGYKIGFFSLADTVSVTEKIGLVNEETPIANDLAQTASEQVPALQAKAWTLFFALHAGRGCQRPAGYAGSVGSDRSH